MCQRGKSLYMSKEEVSLPTVSIKDLFLTCIIDRLEERDVAVVDIPGAFIQTDIKGETIHLKLEGKMVDILN